MASRAEITVALDVGTHRTAVLVAERVAGTPRITGVGTAPSRGLRRGAVVNIEATVHSITSAVREAEGMADCNIRAVLVALGGSHIRSLDTSGMTPIHRREVDLEDIDRVHAVARAVAVPEDREVVHVLPQDYVVDGQAGVRDPYGMTGVRLEVRAHVLTAARGAVQNLVRCCNRAGLEASQVVVAPIASAHAVLTPEEREIGAVMVDIGGGTTEIVVVRGGAVRRVSVVGLGGGHVTGDIAAGLRTTSTEAERIKLRHGHALAAAVRAGEHIEVNGIGGHEPRMLSRQVLAEIIEPRADEILSLVRERLEETDLLGALPAGVVLTGGSASLPGLVELGEKVFRLPVRLGEPHRIAGVGDVVSGPMWATAIGLLELAGAESEGFELPDEMPAGVVARFRNRMGDWLREFF